MKKANITYNAHDNRVTDIIKRLVPPDAEERVDRSLKQWNQTVRDHIRNETGLKLTSGDSRFAIPVRVVNGFPNSLSVLFSQYNDPVMWRLIVGQPKIGGLIRGLEFLLEGWDEFESWPSLPKLSENGRPVLERALTITTSLQQAAMAANVLNQIKNIHSDILGMYRFVSGEGASVELYWLPIAMFAAMIDVPIEDLTVVVLIHELAHGYTHVGRDIDGANWSNFGFQFSAVEVVEGLAQFYTAVIAERLATRTPRLLTAYEALLNLQSGPYLVHKEWMKDDRRQIGETVRFAMITARSQGIVTYDQWNEMMKATKKNLTQN